MDNAVGARIKAERLRHNQMSQRRLGELANCWQTEISRWEAGYQRPSRRALERIADALGVTVEDLDSGTHDPGPFAKGLRDRREAIGMTQAQVAAITSVHVTTVSAWEAGTREPSLGAVVQLAQVFGVTTDWLLGAHPVSGDGNISDPLTLSPNST